MHSKYLVTDGKPRADGLEISRHGTIVGDAGEDFARAVEWANDRGPGARVVREDLDPGQSVVDVLVYEVPAVSPAEAMRAWAAAKATKNLSIATEPVVQALRGLRATTAADLEPIIGRPIGASIGPGRYRVRCDRGDDYEQNVREGSIQFAICGACGAPARFDRLAFTPLEVALKASLLAQDPDALRRLASSTDPTEELEDGSLLRVLRTTRGFRIEHLAKSAPAAPEQSWEIDERGRVLA